MKNRYLAWAVESVRHGGAPASALFAFHVVVALGFDAYTYYPSLDIPMHFLGGTAIAYFFHRASMAASEVGVIGPFHPVTHRALVFALTCTATVFWEFAEYLTDRYAGTHAQVGLEDTLGDMLLGLLGGVVLLISTWSVRGGEAPRLEID